MEPKLALPKYSLISAGGHMKRNFEKKVTILKHFPFTQAAEHEVIPRLKASLEELGFGTQVLELHENLTEKQINDYESDSHVVIDLHFQHPKFLNLNSFGLLWSPVSFMSDWGLGKSWSNQMSHDFLLSTGDSETKKIASLYRTDEHDYQVLNHSLPGSWLVEPKTESVKKDIRAFYAGIGWDKFNNRPGRHQEIFAYLDEKNLLDLYGPENIQGLKPWKDFSSYRGVIPFDGRSILELANASGAMLVFSSEAHKKANIMSNRLFEALASRCIVIGDDHPYLREVMGDKAFYLDLTKSPEIVAKDLQYILEYLSDNPQTVRNLTDFGAALFLKRFDLTKQLENVFLNFDDLPSVIERFAAVVFGEFNDHLLNELKSQGINQVTFSREIPQNVENLIEIVKGIGRENTIVLTSDVTLMSNFSARVQRVTSNLAANQSHIAFLSGVSLKDKESFAPRIISKGTGLEQAKDMSSINGILIMGTPDIADWDKSEVDPVVCFRINKTSTRHFLELASGPAKVLINAKKIGGNQQISIAINSEAMKHINQREDFITNYIVTSGKAVRMRILFSLLAAIPGIGILKKLFRNRVIRLLAKNV